MGFGCFSMERKISLLELNFRGEGIQFLKLAVTEMEVVVMAGVEMVVAVQFQVYDKIFG